MITGDDYTEAYHAFDGDRPDDLPDHQAEPIGCELGNGWINTITVFLEKGLDVDTMRLLAERSMLNTRVHYSQVWRYFCGCCWRFLDDAQNLARELP